MTRDEAHDTIRRATTVLLALEHRLDGMHQRIHGATLLLSQVLVTSARMPEREAVVACTRAAELAAERVLVGPAAPRITGVDAHDLEWAGSELLALAHRQVIEELAASTPTCPAAGVLPRPGRSHAAT